MIINASKLVSTLYMLQMHQEDKRFWQEFHSAKQDIITIVSKLISIN